MMVPLRWETFTGNNFDVGRQLGRYWVERLEACGKSTYGRSFLKEKQYEKWLSGRRWLGDIQKSKDYACFVRIFHSHFPSLVEEIDGMVQGAKDAGYKAFFESMFDLCL